MFFSFPTKSYIFNVRISKRLKMAKPLSFAERFMSAHWEGWQSDLVTDILHLVDFDPITSRNLIPQYIVSM